MSSRLITFYFYTRLTIDHYHHYPWWISFWWFFFHKTRIIGCVTWLWHCFINDTYIFLLISDCFQVPRSSIRLFSLLFTAASRPFEILGHQSNQMSSNNRITPRRIIHLFLLCKVLAISNVRRLDYFMTQYIIVLLILLI